MDSSSVQQSPMGVGGAGRRRRRMGVPAPTAPLVVPRHGIGSRGLPTFGYHEVELPPGSRRIGPVMAGDQGISPGERPHAEQAIRRLFEAPGVDMIATYDQADGTYELRSRTGSVRWERWATPEGEIRYRVVARVGDNPIPSIDGTILRTLEEEAAAAGGVGRHVPKERNSYPDVLARLTQLFDHARAPDFVHIPTPGGDPNHPGAGSHGIPDIVQSRSPLIIAGPGIARGAVSDLLVRHEDIAPTVAELMGVQPVLGTNTSGVVRQQWLRWQDGHSIAGAIADARVGAQVRGSAQRVLMVTVDGMSQTALLDEVRAGRLPNIARLMASGTTFRNGSLAQYPVVTWSNHNTIVTGAAPGHNGLVNNSWYERGQQREQLVTDGSGTNVLRTGRLMNPNVETLYEAVERSFPNVRTMAINQPSGRGADVSVLDLVGFPTMLANIGRFAVEMLRGMADVDPSWRDDKQWRNQSLADVAATSLVDTFWRKRNAPKLGVVELTMVDEKGHGYGPHHDEARRALRQVDRQIGRMLQTLERRGIAGSTTVVLTADHGMAHQTLNEKDMGGWKQAVKRAAKDGVRVVESTRFVYVRSVRWSVEGSVPAAGTSGELMLSITNDDADDRGEHPPIEGAAVTVRDGSGSTWRGVTDASGRVRMPIAPQTGPLEVMVEHGSFSRERGIIPLPGATGSAAATRRRRSSIRG